MSEGVPADRLKRALGATADIVAGVRADQWNTPTPCAEWNARALLNHLVVGNHLFADLLSGAEPPSPEQRRASFAVDRLGDDLLAAYRDSASALVTAFRRPGVLEQVFQASIGAAPGAVLLRLRLTEALVHGWDLARATGQPARLPDDLAEEALAFSSGRSAPDVPRTGNPFGPAQPVPDDAPAVDRLAAYLGRRVEFQASGAEGA